MGRSPLLCRHQRKSKVCFKEFFFFSAAIVVVVVVQLLGAGDLF